MNFTKSKKSIKNLFNKFRYIEINIEKNYLNSPIIFKLIFDKVFRNSEYIQIKKVYFSDLKEYDNNKMLFSISEDTKKVVLEKYNQKKIVIKKDEEYIFFYYQSKFLKSTVIFLSILFGLNLIIIKKFKKSLIYKIPFKSDENYARKIIQINKMKNFLFYTFIFYQFGFIFFISLKFSEYSNLKNIILHNYESELSEENKEDLLYYQEIFEKKPMH